MALGPFGPSSARGAPQSRAPKHWQAAGETPHRAHHRVGRSGRDDRAGRSRRLPRAVIRGGRPGNIAGYATSGDLVNLLRSLGPGIMRFGGISADETTAWLQEGVAPAWAQATVTPQDLAGLAALARASGWRVLLTVNLGHGEPAAAAQEAQGRRRRCSARAWQGSRSATSPTATWRTGCARRVGAAAYLAEAAAYRTAIAAAAPGVQIVGPDASTRPAGAAVGDGRRRRPQRAGAAHRPLLPADQLRRAHAQAQLPRQPADAPERDVDARAAGRDRAREHASAAAG